MKIQLRPYILQDQNQLVLLANNPNVSANLNDQFPYPFTNQDALNCINKANQPNSRIIEFAITVDKYFVVLYHLPLVTIYIAIVVKLVIG